MPSVQLGDEVTWRTWRETSMPESDHLCEHHLAVRTPTIQPQRTGRPAVFQRL